MKKRWVFEAGSSASDDPPTAERGRHDGRWKMEDGRWKMEAGRRGKGEEVYL